MTLLRFANGSLAGAIWKGLGARDQLSAAFSAIIEGRTYFSPEVREAMSRMRREPTAFFKILSAREIGLLPRLGRGESDSEIAAAEGLATGTVKSHRQHIMAKLNLSSTRDLMRWAAVKGFVANSSLGDRPR